MTLFGSMTKLGRSKSITTVTKSSVMTVGGSSFGQGMNGVQCGCGHGGLLGIDINIGISLGGSGCGCGGLNIGLNAGVDLRIL